MTILKLDRGSSSKYLAIENVVGSTELGTRLVVESLEHFSSSFILLFIEKRAWKVGATEDAIKGTTKAWFLQKHLWLWTRSHFKRTEWSKTILSK